MLLCCCVTISTDSSSLHAFKLPFVVRSPQAAQFPANFTLIITEKNHLNLEQLNSGCVWYVGLWVVCVCVRLCVRACVCVSARERERERERESRMEFQFDIPVLLRILWSLAIGGVVVGFLPLGNVSEFVRELSRRGKLRLSPAESKPPVRQSLRQKYLSVSAHSFLIMYGSEPRFLSFCLSVYEFCVCVIICISWTTKPNKVHSHVLSHSSRRHVQRHVRL